MIIFTRACGKIIDPSPTLGLKEDILEFVSCRYNLVHLRAGLLLTYFRITLNALTALPDFLNTGRLAMEPVGQQGSSCHRSNRQVYIVMSWYYYNI